MCNQEEEESIIACFEDCLEKIFTIVSLCVC